MTREDQIKKAAEIIAYGCSDELKVALIQDFPELNESEDERHRKWILEYLYDGLRKADEQFKGQFKSAIAWFEKQKENPKSADSIPSDCVSDAKCEDRSPKHSDSDGTDIRDTPAYWKGWDDAMKQKEQKHPNGCFTCDEYKKGYESGRSNGFTAGYNKAMKEVEQKEQKPEEWSEEDKAMIERLIRHTQKEFDELCNDRYGHQEIISDLKDSCRERMNWLENRLKSLRPHPKQEWSEEDEDVFNDILLDMGDRREMFKSKGETTFAENTQKKIDWLDSHHLQLKYSYCPQPEQEWSDRDKEMLEFVLGLLDNLVWRRDWEISKAECLEWLVKSLNPTKKEWSEDDEKMRINILNALTPQLVYSSGKGTYTGTSTYKYDDEIKWLKSLRPSWKLSEDEERLINTSISFLKDFADKGYENAVECIDWLKSKLNGNSCK